MQMLVYMEVSCAYSTYAYIQYTVYVGYIYMYSVSVACTYLYVLPSKMKNK